MFEAEFAERVIKKIPANFAVNAENQKNNREDCIL